MVEASDYPRKNEKFKQRSATSRTDTWRDIETRAKSKFTNTVSSPSHTFGRCIGRAPSGGILSRCVAAASNGGRDYNLSIDQIEDAILSDIPKYVKTVFESLRLFRT